MSEKRPSNFDLSGLAAPKKTSRPTPPEDPTVKPTRQKASVPAARPSGFKARRTADPLRRQRLAAKPRSEQRHQFNVRMLPDDAAQFIQFAEAEGLTYGDLVARMVKRVKEVGLYGPNSADTEST